MNKPKYLSEDEIEKIVESGIKKEVDEETYKDNWAPGECCVCFKNEECEKDMNESWEGNCDEWEYVLTCKTLNWEKVEEE